jgi:hypothetical protein
MLNKFASLTLVLALTCTPGGPSALASTPSDPEPKPKPAEAPSESGVTTRHETKLNEELRAGVLRLVADAKAGKFASRPRLQIQPARSNNLSTKAKIAIGVAVAIVVLGLIVNHERKNFFNCKSRCVI